MTYKKLASIGLIDQGIVSGTSFITSLMAARIMPPADFGIFALCLTLFSFALNLQAALITQPISVIAPRNLGEANISYISASAIQQIVLVAALTLVISSGLSISYYVKERQFLGIFLLVIISAVITFQFNEFFRRVLLSRQKVKALLISDGLGNFLRLSLLAYLIFYRHLSLVNLFLIIALGYLLSSMIGAKFSNIKWKQKPEEIKRAASLNWDHGKWLLGTNVIVWSLGTFYLYIVALTLGPAKAGAYAAIVTLFGPLTVLFQGFDNVTAPAAAEKLEKKGLASFQSFMKRATTTFLWPTLGYCLFLAIFAEPVLHVLYKGKYDGYGLVVAIFSLFLIVSLFIRTTVISFRVIQKTEYLQKAYLFSAGFMLIASYPLVKFLNLPGAALGISINTVITYLFMRHLFKKILYKNIIPIFSMDEFL